VTAATELAVAGSSSPGARSAAELAAIGSACSVAGSASSRAGSAAGAPHQGLRAARRCAEAAALRHHVGDTVQLHAMAVVPLRVVAAALPAPGSPRQGCRVALWAHRCTCHEGGEEGEDGRETGWEESEE
jgi:hypothetical protein